MSIKSVGVTVVAFILICSVVSMIAPKGKMENSIKLVISLGFIFVIITTIFNLKIDLPKIEYNQPSSTKSEDIYELSLKATKEILINKIKAQLANENVNLEYLEINADILQDNSIIINNIIYKTRDIENEFLIENTIKEITGCQNIMRKNDEEYITKQNNSIY